MTDRGSSLAAALADIDRFTEQHMPPWSVIVAAARERLRLSRIPCETCQGGGRVWRSEGYNPYHPCPSCGGSGEVWPAELVEVVALSLLEADGEDLSGLIGSWADEKMEPYRAKARVVLGALDLYAKEATK